MSNTTLAYAVFCGITFGLWPLVMAASGLPGGLSGVILTATTLVFVTGSYLASTSGIGHVTWSMLGIGFVAGILNGLGTSALTKYLDPAVTPERLVWLAIVTMIAVQITVNTVVPAIRNGQVPTTSQICGVALLLVGVFLVNRK